MVDTCAQSRRWPNRFVITGSPGAGKTTLAVILAARLDIAHIELDSLYHGPDWTPADPDVFTAAVTAAVAGPAWVADGNYAMVRGIIRGRADLVVALDLPRPIVFARLVRRTLRRMITREELWNGNREEFRHLLTRDPEENLLLWAHRNFAKYRTRAKADERASRTGGPAAVRLTSPAQVRRFVAYLVESSPGQSQPGSVAARVSLPICEPSGSPECPRSRSSRCHPG